MRRVASQGAHNAECGARVSTISTFVLFVDLVKAFDRIIRQLVFGWGPVRPVDAVAQLCQLGVAEDAAKWMVQYIDERGHLLLQWSVDAGATALAESLHRHAWFSVGDLDTVVTSRTGGRQGCKLGALAHVQQRLRHRP